MSRSVQSANLSCPVVFVEGSICDMHVHTNLSDGLVLALDLLAYLNRRNLRAAITDHNTITGVQETYTHAAIADLSSSRALKISAIDGPHLRVYFETLSELASYYEHSIAGYQGGMSPHGNRSHHRSGGE